MRWLASTGLLLGLLCTATAAADEISVEMAFEAAAYDIAATLNRRNPGGDVALTRFLDSELQIACEPLSGSLRDRLMDALIQYRDDFGLGFETQDRAQGDADLILTGRWLGDMDGSVRLSLLVGESHHGAQQFHRVQSVTFDSATLTSAAVACLNSYEPVQQLIRLERPQRLLDGPYLRAPVIADLPAGDSVFVSALVTGERWAAVDLGNPALGQARFGFTYLPATLAQQLRPSEPAATPEAADAITISHTGWLNIQRALDALGFPVGATDGLPGPATRRGVAAWQDANELRTTGYLDEQQVGTLLTVARRLNSNTSKASDSIETPPHRQTDDCFWRRDGCPEMVAMPTDSFAMGPPGDERPTLSARPGAPPTSRLEVLRSPNSTIDGPE